MGPIDTFTTERLRAVRLHPGHLAELRRMHRDVDVMAHLGGVQSEAETQAYMERNLRHWEAHGFGLYILHEHGGGAPIGRGVLRHVTVGGIDELEIGYAFYPQYWRRGLASEVTGATVALAFDRVGASSVVALTSAGNAGSRGVLVKAQFIEERPVDLDGVPLLLYRRLPLAAAR